MMDQMLFVAVTMSQDAMPTISIESAIRRFQRKFGHICEDCSEESLVQRYRRMRERYNDTLKTPQQ